MQLVTEAEHWIQVLAAVRPYPRIQDVQLLEVVLQFRQGEVQAEHVFPLLR